MTQHEKILKLMATDPERWWLPQDFMRPELGEYFVGYEASARLSELAKLYPDKIESQRQGKYMARRLIPEIMPEPTPEPIALPEQQTLMDVPPARKRYI